MKVDVKVHGLIQCKTTVTQSRVFHLCLNMCKHFCISYLVFLPSKISVTKLLNGVSNLLHTFSMLSRCSAPFTSSVSNVIADFKGFFHLNHNYIITFVDLISSRILSINALICIFPRSTQSLTLTFNSQLTVQYLQPFFSFPNLSCSKYLVQYHNSMT